MTVMIKTTFTHFCLTKPWDWMNSQLVNLLLLTLPSCGLWFQDISILVTEVAVVPVSRWLPTFSLISLTFIILFVVVLSRLSLARRVPEESWSICLIQQYLSYWSILFSCSLIVSSLPHLSLHRKAGILQFMPMESPYGVR